jgi:hypothetical protein
MPEMDGHMLVGEIRKLNHKFLPLFCFHHMDIEKKADFCFRRYTYKAD